MVRYIARVVMHIFRNLALVKTKNQTTLFKKTKLFSRPCYSSLCFSSLLPFEDYFLYYNMTSDQFQHIILAKKSHSLCQKKAE